MHTVCSNSYHQYSSLSSRNKANLHFLQKSHGIKHTWYDPRSMDKLDTLENGQMDMLTSDSWTDQHCPSGVEMPLGRGCLHLCKTDMIPTSTCFVGLIFSFHHYMKKMANTVKSASIKSAGFLFNIIVKQMLKSSLGLTANLKSWNLLKHLFAHIWTAWAYLAPEQRTCKQPQQTSVYNDDWLQ